MVKYIFFKVFLQKIWW